MKIGLVSPYVYPLPGGVTEHVRYLYEGLRLRGHHVRIITSSHGLQRSYIFLLRAGLLQVPFPS